MTSHRGLGRDFGYVFTANLSSSLGDGIARVAVPLLAARLTDDPLLISGIAALAMLPWLLFAIPAGVLVDRVDRRHALFAANTVRTALAALIMVLVATDRLTVWWLYGVIFVYGAFETVYDGAIRAVVPSVVGRANLHRANSRIEAAEIVVQNLLAAPVTSYLLALATLVPLGLNTAAYAVAGGLALFLPRAVGRPRPTPTASPPPDVDPSVPDAPSSRPTVTPASPSPDTASSRPVVTPASPSPDTASSRPVVTPVPAAPNPGPSPPNVTSPPDVTSRPDPATSGGDGPAGPAPAWHTQLADGLKVIWSVPVLRRLWLVSSLDALFFSAATSTMVLFVLDRLGVPEDWFGAFMLSGAVGALLGSVVAGRLARAVGSGRAMALGVLGASLPLLVMGLYPQIAVAALCYALGSGAVTIWNVLVMSLRQAAVPAHLLGRVHGTWRTLLWGVVPLGSVIGGRLARIDLTTPLIVGGAATLVIGLVWFRFFSSLPEPKDLGERGLLGADR